MASADATLRGAPKRSPVMSHVPGVARSRAMNPMRRTIRQRRGAIKRTCGDTVIAIAQPSLRDVDPVQVR